MNKLLSSIVALFLFTGGALAQNAGTVTNHAIPIGKGAGTTGYGSLLLGSGQIAIGQTTADPSAITPTGDVTITAAGVTAVGTNKVTNGMLRQSGALALIGRSANSTGNVADITATAGSSCVFLESSSTLTCATIATANIAANAVTNAKMATAGAYTFKGNATGSTAALTDIDPTALTLKASPGTSDIVVIQDVSASNQTKKTTVGALSTAGSVASLNGQTGAIVSYFPPQGRLTLVTATPVMLSSQAASTTIYYTPYVGDMVPIYDGTNIVPTSFPEVSQINSDSTKSPTSVATNSCYNLYAWMDSGTPRVTRGFIWTNTTTPGANSALTRVKGLLLNNVSITNGPAASRGTFVGVACSNGTATFDFVYGASGSGGVAASFGLWNAYNQFPTTTSVIDTQTAYSNYSTATIRQAGGSAGNQITFVQGTTAASVPFAYTSLSRAPGVSGAFINLGVGFDSTSTFTFPYQILMSAVASPQVYYPASINGVWNVGVGQHTLSANEKGDGTNLWTFNALSLNTLSATIWN